jgi:hypothetical protein
MAKKEYPESTATNDVSVGDMVMVVPKIPPSMGADPANHYPALVASINKDGTLNVAAFDRMGRCGNFVNMTRGDGKTPLTWHPKQGK